MVLRAQTRHQASGDFRGGRHRARHANRGLSYVDQLVFYPQRIDRQDEAEGAALSFFRSKQHVSTVCGNDFFCEKQADASAVWPLAAGVTGAIKLGKQVYLLFFGYANARVFDG